MKEQHTTSIVIDSTTSKTNPQIAIPLSKIIGKAKLLDQRLEIDLGLAESLKRDRLAIIAEILAFCIQRKNKTNIMYKTNLNYAQLQTHLQSPMSKDLLKQDSKTYVTTEKGMRFLELFIEIRGMLKTR